ncbi:MAG: hypothetical protein ACPGTQ_06800 [Colwellia sp.]
MDRAKVTVLAIFLGTLYAYLSVYITGIGAAISIPASILTPVAKAYPIFAFGIVDLITIGLPLIVVYFLFALMVKYFNSSKSYFPYMALLIPFYVISFYSLATIEQSQDWAYTLGKITPRYIATIAFAIYFVKQTISQKKA